MSDAIERYLQVRPRPPLPEGVILSGIDVNEIRTRLQLIACAVFSAKGDDILKQCASINSVIQAAL